MRMESFMILSSHVTGLLRLTSRQYQQRKHTNKRVDSI